MSELKSYEAYKNSLKRDLDELINKNEELKKQIDDIKKKQDEIQEKIDKEAIVYFRKKLNELNDFYTIFNADFTYNVRYGDKIEKRVVKVLDLKDITEEDGFDNDFDIFIANVNKYYEVQVDSINKGGLVTGKFHKFAGYDKIQKFIEKDLTIKGASYTVDKYKRFFEAFDYVHQLLKRFSVTDLYDLGDKFFDKFGANFYSNFYQDGHLNKEYKEITELNKEMKRLLSRK